MQLKMLTINLCDYGENKGLYTGKVYFANQYGGTDVVLSPELSRRVLEACAEALVEQTKRTAQLITADVLDSVPAIESKP